MPNGTLNAPNIKEIGNASMNRKLLFVINDLSFFFSHRLSLAKAVKEAGYEVHVAAPASNRSSELAQYDFKFYTIPLDRKGVNPLHEIRSVFALYQLYLKIKPNIVHHLTVKPVLYGGIAARLAKVPSVVNAVTGLGYLFVSSNSSAKLLRQFSKLGFYASFRHPNMRVIFQNADDQREFIKNGLLRSDHSVLIKGSGVSLTEFKPLAEPESSRIVVLLPARLLWDKGVGEFIQAAELLRKEPSIQMVLAGPFDSGNPAAIKKKQIDDWVNQGLIEYWGHQNNIQEAFARCHIVCLPSYREGTPRVLIEAAACERPIVTTDVPGCRDIVMDQVNGVLVEVKNSKSLADGILKLASDSTTRQRMGREGRHIVEAGFSSHLVNKNTLAVYSSLLKTK